MEKFQYPETPEGQAIRSMLGGEAPEANSHISSQFTTVNRTYGSGNVDRLTTGPLANAPWPGAGKTKKGPNYDRAAVSKALSQPVELTQTDPRNLHSSQPSVTRAGVDYYMTDEYAQTGKTYADQDNPGNRHPVVYKKSDGRNILLSGHHRASAALVKGEPFGAVHVSGD